MPAAMHATHAPAPLAIGLTGGVASGKSTAARAFSSLGITIVDADRIAREVVAPGTPGLAAVVAHFGPAVLAPDGTLDRAAMRRRVFDDPAARTALEGIVHPLVRSGLEREAAAALGPYCIVDIPLLAEAGRGAYPWLARVLVIDVPVATQRERLLDRDGTDMALADRMIQAQASRAERLAIADDVIVNTGSEEDLECAVAALDARYRRFVATS